MPSFVFENTNIVDLILIKPLLFPDSRGYFSKTFEKAVFAEHGIDIRPFESLCSLSKKHTLRGLHFQRKNCQDKLVQVMQGAVYDVAVDLRAGSETFGKGQGFYLSADDHKMLYIPKGFAHGFLALEEDTLFSYLCGDRYDPETDGGIAWNDPQLAINWPIDDKNELIISDKDSALPALSEFLAEHGPLNVEDR